MEKIFGRVTGVHPAVWIMLMIAAAALANLLTLPSDVPAGSVLLLVLLAVLAVAAFDFPVLGSALFVVAFAVMMIVPGPRLGITALLPPVVAGIVAYSGNRRICFVVTPLLFLLGFVGGPIMPTGAIDPSGITLWAMLFIVLVTVGWWLGYHSRRQRSMMEEWRDNVVERQHEFARALHDSVAASLTSVIMQSEALALTNSRNPVLTETLDSIADAGRTSMTQLRELLTVLNAPEPEPGDAAPSLATILAAMNQDMLEEGFEPVTALEVTDLNVKASHLAVLRGITNEIVRNVAAFGDRSVPLEIKLAQPADSLELTVAGKLKGADGAEADALAAGIDAISRLASSAFGSVVTATRDDHATVRVWIPNSPGRRN